MDFGRLLHTAQKNGKEGKKEPARYYSTKFEPPKKEQRNKQQLSANIKKFLAKKEAEEKEKKLDALRKKDDLMALRAKDKKATRTMNVMLKRTKSANQSVLQDAIDTNNTSVTLAGPTQPDEDDYGYVSQEASAFYNKMMEKYSKMPDEPKFNLSKKKVSTDLNSTKERVRAALEREKEEALLPHRRKRKHKEENTVHEEPEVVKREEAPKPKRPKAPPPINFNDLLKLAEKKQFEPVVIEQKPKEEEKPLTKKQKIEMEREKEWRDRKEGKLPPLETNRIPKLNPDKKSNGEIRIPKLNGVKKPTDMKTDVKKNQIVKPPEIKKMSKVQSIEKRPIVPAPSLKPSSSATATKLNKSKEWDPKRKEIIKTTNKDVAKIPPRSDLKPRQLPPSDHRPKQFPPKDLKPRQFPPPYAGGRDFPPKEDRRKLLVKKRRILDDEEEYDPEMDDFIDDGPEESEDYSKVISEIFKYDRTKYQYVDEDVDNMESTFAQQMREEVISTKIGKMEDLEDMRQEEEEKRLKKKRKK